jgi:outer membrane protein
MRYLLTSLSLSAVLLLGATSLTAQASDLKLGYVNTEQLLRESAPAKAALARLELEFGKRDRELREAEQRIKSAGEKLDKEGMTLSESERSRRQRDLVDQDRDLQRKRREFQEDLNQRKSEELSAVVERANRVIKQIFEQEKYDLIVQEALAASSRIDITDKVVKALNAASPK